MKFEASGKELLKMYGNLGVSDTSEDIHVDTTTASVVEPEFEWLPTEWLETLMEKTRNSCLEPRAIATEVPPIAMRVHLCVHGKVGPDSVLDLKAANPLAVDALVAKYGCDGKRQRGLLEPTIMHAYSVLPLMLGPISFGSYSRTVVRGVAGSF